MKDAKGHGSDAAGGGSALDKAITNFQAAHQAGVNEAAPCQSGCDLYNAAMAAAQHSNPANYSTREMQDIEPDFDEMPSGPNPYYPAQRKK